MKIPPSATLTGTAGKGSGQTANRPQHLGFYDSAVLGSSHAPVGARRTLTFDESATDNTNGGGRIAVVLLGGPVKTAYQSSNMYQFQSLLRFSLQSLGVSTYPNGAANAPDMNEFLK